MLGAGDQRIRKIIRNVGVVLVLVVIAALIYLFAPVGGIIPLGRRISFQPSGDPATPVWLIAGPFRDTGDNALFSDLLWWVGGEKNVEAREGGIAGRRWHNLIRWKRATTAPDGLIDFKKIWPLGYHSIAYAYTEIESDSERDIVATLGSGTCLQVWLNGRVVFENRLMRHFNYDRDTVVLHIQKGTNRVLVKALEMSEQLWRLQWQTRIPTGPLFVNRTQIVIPDFVVGDTQGAWGQVEVANVGQAAMPAVTVEVEGDGMVQPARSDPVPIEPGQVQRIPVWISTAGPAPDSAPGPIRLKVSSGSDTNEQSVLPKMRHKGQYFETTFRSAIDGSVQTYSVWLPTKFDPSVIYPVVLALHGGTVTDWWQNIFSYTQKDWAIIAAPYGRGDNSFQGIGEADLDEMIKALGERYHIDHDRLYLSGHSDGGYGAWFQASRRPDLWSSISPQAAVTDAYFQRTDLQNAGGSVQRDFQKKLLDDRSPIKFAENLMYVPAYVVHGGADNEIPVRESQQMYDRLSQLGYTCVLDIVPGKPHWWWGPRFRLYNAGCADKPEIYDFFRKYSPRLTRPRRIVYETDGLRYNKAYWITIDSMDDVNKRARVEADVAEGNVVGLKLVNVSAVTLDLKSAPLQQDNVLIVTVNGRKAYSGLASDTGVLKLVETPDGFTANIKDAANSSAASDSDSVIKTHELFGPISSAFETPFIFVVGTQDQERNSAALNTAVENSAKALARDWMLRANGIVRIKKDSEVSDSDIANYNLILFGNAQNNSLIAKINDSLPVRFSRSAISVGQREFKGGEVGMIEVMPNPLNRSKYVVVVGGHSQKSFAIAARLQFADLPDYVVFDRDTLSGRKTVYVSGGYFDKCWRLVNQ